MVAFHRLFVMGAVGFLCLCFADLFLVLLLVFS